jgi:hypothetical protein
VRAALPLRASVLSVVNHLDTRAEPPALIRLADLTKESAVHALVLHCGLAAWVSLLALAPARAADDTVAILVLKEHGVGNQALAQPYLDRMVALTAKQNNWSNATGKYFTSRSAAEAFIKSTEPHYAILSLPAFLAMRKPYKLETIGKVAVSLAGGRHYYVISKTADDLNDCKGKTLATDHGDDPRFIERVVFGGAAKLTDFTVVPTQRPLQTIKTVLNGQAVCALIDDAQRDQIDHLADKDGVRTVWESRELPPMPVVAFPNAPRAERETFKKNLDAVCDGDGKAACAEIGIDDLTRGDASDYAAVTAAYDK